MTVAVLMAGCGGSARSAQPAAPTAAHPEAASYAGDLRQRVGVEAMMGHLHTLQDIADANGGTRAVETPGYRASVDFVANALRDRGFDVQTPEFTFRVSESEPGTISAGGARYEARPLQYTVGTSGDGVRGPLVPAPVEDTPGCTASDYDGLPVAGAVVLVDRGTCPFSEKLAAAAQRGAAALIIADNVDEETMGGTLGEDTEVTIPVVSVTKPDGAALRGYSGAVTVALNASVRDVTARNVIAQTKTGSTENVVMAGAHLDSVPEGPGINDDGSGVAAVLETALQMGPTPPVRNAVRFAFWGAEELGLVGSRSYIETLSVEGLKDIALYLNFDMLASPNAGYFTYDGDQSAPRESGQQVPRVPEGSAGIERTLVEYLNSAGKPAQDTEFDGRSDYDAFTRAGVPSGGLFAGAEQKKTAEQAQLWGGQADEPYDPNYHKAGDTIDNIDQDCLAIQGGGVAFAVGLYAQDLSGRNGIPDRADRTRHAIKES